MTPLNCGTTMNHTIEVLIDSHFVFLLSQKLPHRMADVNLVRKDDIAVERTIPVRHVLKIKGVPWEESVAICQ